MDFYSSLDSSQLDASKPTIFEVASASQLDSLLTPSLRFLLVHYTHKYPRLLIRVLNNFDELNTLLRGIIEFLYLKNWNATFIEKFYGIKRVSSKPITPKNPDSAALKFNEIKRLTKTQILLSLLDTVIVPYISAKLKLYHEKLVPRYLLNSIQVEHTDEEKLDEKNNAALHLRIINLLYQLKTKLRDCFYKYYPATKLILNLISVLLNILYLSNKTDSISIIQLLSKVSYSRITQEDHQRIESKLMQASTNSFKNQNVPPTLSSTLFSNISSVIQPIKKIAWSTTDTVLPVSIFLLKFMEWYNSNNNSNNNNKKNSSASDFRKPIVPTILPLAHLSDPDINELVTTNDANCRLCNNPLHNPGIIETGYVFCFKCIYEHLRDQPKETGGKCPVTGKILLGCSWSETQNEWIVKGLRRVII